MCLDDYERLCVFLLWFRVGVALMTICVSGCAGAVSRKGSNKSLSLGPNGEWPFGLDPGQESLTIYIIIVSVSRRLPRFVVVFGLLFDQSSVCM